MSSLVTVALPTYNRVKGLQRALESVLKQDYPSIDIVVSDNASTDATAEYLSEIAKTDERIRVITHATNNGPLHNFNSCLEVAKGEYFMWLADDDWIAEDYLSVCVGMLEVDNNLVLAGGLAEFPDNPNYKHNLIKLDQNDPFLRLSMALWNLRENSIFYGLYRTKNIKPIGLRDGIAGDWLTVAAMVVVGKVLMSDRTRLYRASGGGASQNHKHTVKLLGLPKWQGYFLKLVIALNFRRFFLQDYSANSLSPEECREMANHTFLVALSRKKIFRFLLNFILPERRPEHVWHDVDLSASKKF